MKTKLDSLREFYNGKLYIFLVFCLNLIGHSTGYDVFFFVLMMLTVYLGCAIAYDLRFAIAPFLSTVLFVTPEHSPNVPSYSDYYAQPLPFTVLAITFGLLIVFVGVFAYRNRRRANEISFSFKGVFFGMVILSVALCLNGAFNDAYSIKNLIYGISFPLILVGFYMLFALFVRFDRCALEHFLFCLLAIGLQITAQLLLLYLGGSVSFLNGAINRDSLMLGWAVGTTFGGMQAFLMPVCFYFAATHTHGWIYYGLGLLNFLSVLLSQSRGAMLTGALALLICVISVCFVGRNKKQNRMITIGLAVIGVAVIAVFWNKLQIIVQDFLNRGFDDNGRFYLWETGIGQFLKHPIFGAGFYDSNIVQEWIINVYPYFYHNTLLQMLASAGVLGILAYLWHRITTVIAIFRRPSVYKSFLGICLLTFLGFCLLDVIFFITYPLLFYSLILLYIEKSDTAEEQ